MLLLYALIARTGTTYSRGRLFCLSHSRIIRLVRSYFCAWCLLSLLFPFQPVYSSSFASFRFRSAKKWQQCLYSVTAAMHFLRLSHQCNYSSHLVAAGLDDRTAVRPGNVDIPCSSREKDQWRTRTAVTLRVGQRPWSRIKMGCMLVTLICNTHERTSLNTWSIFMCSLPSFSVSTDCLY